MLLEFEGNGVKNLNINIDILVSDYGLNYIILDGFLFKWGIYEDFKYLQEDVSSYCNVILYWIKL